MNSHYVPVMYLKGWETFQSNKRKQIFVYNGENGTVFKTIKQVASKEDYYTEETEIWLDREIENKTAPILKKIIEEKKWETNEKLQLSLFLLVLWSRVPYFTEGILNDIRKLSWPRTLSDLHLVRRELNKIGIADEVLEEAFNEDRLNTEEHKKKIYSKLLMRNNYRQDLAFAKMHWKLFEAPDGKEFVTSDNPVSFNREIGLGNQESYFHFPINKNLFLEGRYERTPGEYYEVVEPEKVDELNLNVIKNCDKEVYASINDSGIAEMVKKFAGTDRSIKVTVK